MISVDITGDYQKAIDRAADILLAGGLVAYPTETFYGLAADVRNESAVRRLFAAKKRPADRPVLILIGSHDMLGKYVRHIPSVAQRLMETFWPGGLTLVFEASSRVSPSLTAGTAKIGIRMSSHPVATALTCAIHTPISGTSANISDHPPCKDAQEVLRVFGSGIDLILDAGETPGKTGSTLLDVTVYPPRILREGVITREQFGRYSFDVL